MVALGSAGSNSAAADTKVGVTPTNQREELPSASSLSVPVLEAIALPPSAYQSRK